MVNSCLGWFDCGFHFVFVFPSLQMHNSTVEKNHCGPIEIKDITETREMPTCSRFLTKCKSNAMSSNKSCLSNLIAFGQTSRHVFILQAIEDHMF